MSDTERIFYGAAAVLLSFLSGWLILWVERFGWYGPEVGLAIFAVANGTIFIILLWNGVLSGMHERHDAQAPKSLPPAEANLELRVLQRTSELDEANAAFAIEDSQDFAVQHSEPTRCLCFPLPASRVYRVFNTTTGCRSRKRESFSP